MEKRIGIVGLGNQGEAWALNLQDSGWNVTVLLRPESRSAARANVKGLKSVDLGPNLRTFPIVAILIPDDAMPAFFRTYGKYLREGQSLIFAHGFTLHYGTAPWPNNIDRILLAPTGWGTAVRERFMAGSGVPAILAVENDHTKRAWEIAAQVADGIGASRVGTYRATVREEVEANLFAEQSLLCGGLPALVAEAYDVLVKNGVQPEIAYLECVHELAYMAELFQKKGIHETLRFASPTAQFGGIRAGNRLISSSLRDELQRMFSDIHQGAFAGELAREAHSGFPETKDGLTKLKTSPVESVGKSVRLRMEKGGK